MENIYKPKSLPQVSAPFSYVASELNAMGQPYELLGAPVDSINPSQAFIDAEKVQGIIGGMDSGEPMRAIWLDKDSNNLDGHHRLAASLIKKATHIPAVRLGCDKETAIKVLQEIQAKYDKLNKSKFLQTVLETDSELYTPEKELETKPETITAYRKKPIAEKAPSGNFFALKELEGYKPYEIALDNVLNTDKIDQKIKKQKNPPLALALVWFPELNLEEKSKEMGMHLEDFVNTSIAEKARNLGIDGILYGDKLLQTID